MISNKILLTISIVCTLISCSTANLKRDVIVQTKDKKSISIIDIENSVLNNYSKNELSIISTGQSTCVKDQNRFSAFTNPSPEQKESANFWNDLGVCFYYDNNLAKAEFYFKYALKVAQKNKSDDSAIKNNLGVIMIQQHHFDDGLSLLSPVNDKKMDLRKTCNYISFMITKGHFNEVIIPLNNLLSQYKFTSSELKNALIATLAQSESHLGKYKNAREHYQSILSQIHEKIDQHFFNYLNATIKLKMWKEAKFEIDNIDENKLQQNSHKVLYGNLKKLITEQLNTRQASKKIR